MSASIRLEISSHGSQSILFPANPCSAAVHEGNVCISEAKGFDDGALGRNRVKRDTDACLFSDEIGQNLWVFCRVGVIILDFKGDSDVRNGWFNRVINREFGIVISRDTRNIFDQVPV